MLGVAVRARTCPACDASVRDRSARWCGSCGAPLEPLADDPAPARRRRPPWRRVLLAVAAVAVIAGVALTGGGLVDRGSRTTTVDDPGVAAPDEDARDDLPRGRPPEPTRATEPTCSDGPRHGCFAWIVETGEEAHDRSSVAAGGYVVTYSPTAERITAYDLHDGTAVWAAAADASRDGSPSLEVAEGLVLHHADEALVARDLASGDERWRDPDLATFDLERAQRYEDVLLLAGFQARLSPAAGPIEPGYAVAAIDATTGELRWHQSGTGGAALATGGVGVLLEGGRLRAHGSDGTLRWEVDAGTGDQADRALWARGHAISIRGGSEPARLHRLGDGERLPFEAEALAHDGEHTLMVAVESEDGGEGYTLGDELILLDETGEVWRVPAPTQHCFGPVAFEATTITYTGCDGETIVLRRADGVVRSRTPSAHDPERGWFSGVALGPYELFHEHGVGSNDDLVVVDGRTDREVARLPSETWPIGDGTGWGGGAGHEGVVVLESAGWLVALETPEPVAGDQDAGAAEE